MLALLMVAGGACGGLEEDGEGGEGEPCRTDGTCDAGLVCNADNICEQEQQQGFTALYETTSFQKCSGCHAPGAAGFVDGETEATQNWSTRNDAYQSLQGNASGLSGNFAGCNGAPFIGSTPETSLLVAVFDDTVRSNFTLGDFPDCNSDSISDMTLKIGGALDSAELALLKDWISAGAPDN
jgi:hypothetical protein